MGRHCFYLLYYCFLISIKQTAWISRSQTSYSKFNRNWLDKTAWHYAASSLKFICREVQNLLPQTTVITVSMLSNFKILQNNACFKTQQLKFFRNSSLPICNTVNTYCYIYIYIYMCVCVCVLRWILTLNMEALC